VLTITEYAIVRWEDAAMAEIRPYREKVPKPRMYGGERYSEQYVRNILQIVASQKDRNCQYAIIPARNGMSMTGDDLRMACLDVIQKIRGWHGTAARMVKEVLVGFTGANGLRATR
jgi:hypothetical protein